MALSVGRATAKVAAALLPRMADCGADFEVFAATDTGGKELETAVRTGRCTSVIELSLTDLAVGLQAGSSSDRLTAAALRAIPQVIVPGGCDTEQSLREIERFAKDIAQKASASRGPTAIVMPTGSWSAGMALPPAVAEVFSATLRNWLGPAVALHVVAANIDDPAFVDEVVAAWQQVTSAARGSATN